MSERPAARKGSSHAELAAFLNLTEFGMKVTLKTIGDLRDYLGREPQEVDLPEGANLKDLLRWVEDRYGATLPAYLWDAQEHQFRGPVVLIINKKVVFDFSTPLKDGLEVTVMKALVGG
jgi:molybdopterin synthase sulfur carrier subunit